METKFKNKKLVHQVIDVSWNPTKMVYAHERYESGISVEDIIATDYTGIEKVVLRTFSQHYHLFITLYNDNIRRKKYEL